MLATVRRSLYDLPPDPQDKPWSMATLDEYPISPEALSMVLNVWKRHVKIVALGFPWGIFTIRIAKWVTRLSGVATDEKWGARLSDFPGSARLCVLARLYAETEKLYQSINQPFDSTALDHYLMDLPISAVDEQLLSVFEAEIANVEAGEQALRKKVAEYEAEELAELEVAKQASEERVAKYKAQEKERQKKILHN